jgi:hypothetical protein
MFNKVSISLRKERNSRGGEKDGRPHAQNMQISRREYFCLPLYTLHACHHGLQISKIPVLGLYKY